jgi:hypothetical protein
MGSSSRHLSYAWLLVDPSDNKTNVFFHFTLSINIFLGFRQKIYCLSITIRPTPATLSIPLRIRILHGLRHYCALQQAPHPSPQNRRRVPALPISTLSLSSPQLSACARGCSRASGVIDCMRSGMGSVAGNGDGYGEERDCVGRAF